MSHSCNQWILALLHGCKSTVIKHQFHAGSSSSLCSCPLSERREQKSVSIKDLLKAVMTLASMATTIPMPLAQLDTA